VTKKKKKSGKFNLPRGSWEFADNYYRKQAPLDSDGNPVEGLRLNKDEKEFIEQFNKEYYGNTGRYGRIFTADEQSIRELDAANNARNRDLFTKNNYVPIRNNDSTRYIYHGYDCYISESLKLRGLEETIKELVESAAIDIQDINNNSPYEIQINMIQEEIRKVSINIVKAIQKNKKMTRKEREKDRSKK